MSQLRENFHLFEDSQQNREMMAIHLLSFTHEYFTKKHSPRSPEDASVRLSCIHYIDTISVLLVGLSDGTIISFNCPGSNIENIDYRNPILISSPSDTFCHKGAINKFQTYSSNQELYLASLGQDSAIKIWRYERYFRYVTTYHSNSFVHDSLFLPGTILSSLSNGAIVARRETQASKVLKYPVFSTNFTLNTSGQTSFADSNIQASDSSPSISISRGNRKSSLHSSTDLSSFIQSDPFILSLHSSVSHSLLSIFAISITGDILVLQPYAVPSTNVLTQSIFSENKKTYANRPSPTNEDSYPLSLHNLRSFTASDDSTEGVIDSRMNEYSFVLPCVQRIPNPNDGYSSVASTEVSRNNHKIFLSYFDGSIWSVAMTFNEKFISKANMSNSLLINNACIHNATTDASAYRFERLIVPTGGHNTAVNMKYVNLYGALVYAQRNSPELYFIQDRKASVVKIYDQHTYNNQNRNGALVQSDGFSTLSWSEIPYLRVSSSVNISVKKNEKPSFVSTFGEINPDDELKEFDAVNESIQQEIIRKNLQLSQKETPLIESVYSNALRTERNQILQYLSQSSIPLGVKLRDNSTAENSLFTKGTINRTSAKGVENAPDKTSNASECILQLVTTKDEGHLIVMRANSISVLRLFSAKNDIRKETNLEFIIIIGDNNCDKMSINCISRSGVYAKVDALQSSASKIITKRMKIKKFDDIYTLCNGTDSTFYTGHLSGTVMRFDGLNFEELTFSRGSDKKAHSTTIVVMLPILQDSITVNYKTSSLMASNKKHISLSSVQAYISSIDQSLATNLSSMILHTIGKEGFAGVFFSNEQWEATHFIVSIDSHRNMRIWKITKNNNPEVTMAKQLGPTEIVSSYQSQSSSSEFEPISRVEFTTGCFLWLCRNYFQGVFGVDYMNGPEKINFSNVHSPSLLSNIQGEDRSPHNISKIGVVLLGDSKGFINFFVSVNFSFLGKLYIHNYGVANNGISLCGNYYFTCGNDGTMHCWVLESLMDWVTQSMSTTYPETVLHEKVNNSIAYTVKYDDCPVKQFLFPTKTVGILLYPNNKLLYYEIATGRILQEDYVYPIEYSSQESKKGCDAEIKQNNRDITSIYCCSGNRLLAIAFEDKSVVWKNLKFS